VNVLAVENCRYIAVCSAAQGASAPTGQERGGAYRGGRPPAYSLLHTYMFIIKSYVKVYYVTVKYTCSGSRRRMVVISG